MNRRGFVKRLLGAAAALPLVGRVAPEVEKGDWFELEPEYQWKQYGSYRTVEGDSALGEIVQTTLRRRGQILAQNITSHNELLSRLKR